MWRFWLPCRIHFGGDQLSLAGNVVHGARRAVIVSGRNSARKSGALSRLQMALDEAGVESKLYDEVSENPQVEEVDRARDLIADLDANVVICIGGGSAMDLGKAAALLADLPGTTLEYLLGEHELPSSGRQIVTIPTTVGTGAEISRGAVLSASTLGLKNTLRSGGLFASHAIVDPTLASTLSRRQAALGCFDLLTHLVEGFISRRAQPFTDALTRQALPKWMGTITRFLDSREDTEAQSSMAYLSLVGGAVLANSSTCMPHRVQYAMAGVYPSIPHACGVGILFPSWLKIVADNAPGPLQELTSILYPSDGIARFREWVTEFLEREDMPRSLTGAGISAGDLVVIASKVMGDITADPSYGAGRVEQLLADAA